jgi:flagellar hook-basal body complex protein FliE
MDGVSSVGSIVANVVKPASSPAPFLPDLGDESPMIVTPLPPLDSIDGVAAGDDTAASGAVTAAAAASGGEKTFADTLKGYLDDVNDKMVTSDKGTRDLAAGKTNDVQSVVQSTEEANLAFSFTMAMRTKLLSAYQEVARMQV